MPGFAEIGTGTFKFQPDYIDKGEPEGKITVFSDVAGQGQIEPPPKRPRELKKNWGIGPSQLTRADCTSPPGSMA